MSKFQQRTLTNCCTRRAKRTRVLQKIRHQAVQCLDAEPPEKDSSYEKTYSEKFKTAPPYRNTSGRLTRRVFEQCSVMARI